MRGQTKDNQINNLAEVMKCLGALVGSKSGEHTITEDWPIRILNGYTFAKDDDLELMNALSKYFGVRGYVFAEGNDLECLEGCVVWREIIWIDSMGCISTIVCLRARICACVLACVFACFCAPACVLVCVIASLCVGLRMCVCVCMPPCQLRVQP